MGTRVAVANLELRIPFTGPEKLTLFKSNMLFTDLNFFVDAGIAWNSGDVVKFKNKIDVIGTQPVLDNNGNPILDSNGNPLSQYMYEDIRIPAMSAGVSVRINLFGAMILEPYYAIPFQRSDVKFGSFGLNFAPGW